MGLSVSALVYPPLFHRMLFGSGPGTLCLIPVYVVRAEPRQKVVRKVLEQTNGEEGGGVWRERLLWSNVNYS